MEEQKDMFELVEMRVGKVLEVEIHPDADSMYVEKIDLGETNVRTIVSGLRNHISVEDFTGKQVVIVCNLKPRKLRGILSHGMVLCASNDDHSKVELICPTFCVQNGSRVVADGLNCSEPTSRLNPKKKIWEQVVEHLKTNDNCEATYKGKTLFTKCNTDQPFSKPDGYKSVHSSESRPLHESVSLKCETLMNALLG